LTARSLHLALVSRRVVTPQGERHAAILIDNNSIVDVVSPTEIPSNYTIEDFGNLVIMPGLVDTHVHINEPGRTEWEGFETATKAAATGGITTLVDMPLNSSPVTTTVDAFHKKCEAAEGKLYVDCGFYAGVIPGNAEEIEPLIREGVLGVKAFLIHSGIDEFPNVTESDLRAVMPIIARYNLPLLVHCELSLSNPKLQIPPDRRAGANPKSYFKYLSSRPRQWEHDAIALMIQLSKEFSCKVHIVHVSSSDALPMLKNAHASGLPVTTETCPHYLFFTAEEIPDGDTRFKCAPPIREKENRERLWDGMRDGVIDFIVSDHSPSLPAMKCLESGDFQKAWGGIASLQFGLSIVWTEARRRGFTIQNVAEWMCRCPAQLVGLDSRKGAIAPGYDADIVVWDPEQQFIVEQSMIHHRHKITPYEGRSLYGKVIATFLGGKKIVSHGTVDGKPSGKVMYHEDTKARR
jgi:allantoinase